MSAFSMGKQADNLREIRVGPGSLDALNAQEDKDPYAMDIVR